MVMTESSLKFSFWENKSLSSLHLSSLQDKWEKLFHWPLSQKYLFIIISTKTANFFCSMSLDSSFTTALNVGMPNSKSIMRRAYWLPFFSQ
jgi:hypothetical protein